MFGKNYNNFSGNSINVNTRIYTSYSDESLLTLSAWNSNLSLKLQPAKGKNEDGITQYSSEISENVIASITPETNQVIIDGIENEILPAIKNKTEASIGIVTGATQEKRKIINIATDGNKVVLNLIFGGTINLDGTSEGSSVLMHTFKDRSYIKEYKQNAGGELKQVPSDFYAFINKIKELKYVDGAIAHGITYNNTIKSAVAASKNNNVNESSQNTYSAPVTNIGDDSLDGFLPFN